MAGYRRVNYYELCRLCTSSEGTKMHIFREEGRRRQLPTKIQICLPLQVLEDDSLPKIICSHCVDKLESFYDFRESCVNAEAMLESYFTSLRYSDDFTREGKVYVKDESPSKKKAPPPEPEPSPKHLKPTILPDGLNSLVQAAGIQIVTDEDGTRVQQYKCQLQMGGPAQATVVEAAEARYSYEPCNTNPRSVEGSKVEDGSTQCSENDFSNKSVARQQTPESSDNDGDLSNEQQPTLTFTTDNQLLAAHYTCNKDRVDAARSSIAQIGEFLRIKSVNIDATNQAIIEAPTINLQNTLQTRINCERCQKQFLNLEEFQTHQCIVDPSDLEDKNSPQNGGNFACEVCGKPFKRKEHLFQHRKLHTGERPYVCTSCGKAFSRKEHLVRHAVSHTGQKVHACDLCGKTFSRKDNLHKHRKTHGIAGPYICETCGKSFVVKHYYLMHKISHNTGQDTDTGQGEDGGMESHEEDPLSFKCDICNKGFASKSYLSSHKQRHKKALANASSPQQKGHSTLHHGMASNEAADAQQLLSRLTEGQHILTNNQPLTTINNAALLAPNILHHVGGQPSTGLVQVSSAAATAYLCAPTTVAASELIETYRRLHSA